MDKKIQERFRNQFPLLFACFVCMIFFFNPGNIFADSFNVNISGPTTVAVGTTVQYSAPVIDNADYVWTFGNGTGSTTGQTVSHTFTSGGNWNVSVNVSVNASPPSEGSGSINVTVVGVKIDEFDATYVDQTGDECYITCTVGDLPIGGDLTITVSPPQNQGNPITPGTLSSDLNPTEYNSYTRYFPYDVSSYTYYTSPYTMEGEVFTLSVSYTYNGVTSNASATYIMPEPPVFSGRPEFKSQ